MPWLGLGVRDQRKNILWKRRAGLKMQVRWYLFWTSKKKEKEDSNKEYLEGKEGLKME